MWIGRTLDAAEDLRDAPNPEYPTAVVKKIQSFPRASQWSKFGNKQEEEEETPQTAYRMTITWASHIANTVMTGK